MKHLSDNQLSARLDGALSGDDLARVKSHLAACLECRSRLETLANEERALRRALEHDPGEAYFATFADRVQGRLRAEGLAGAQARERGRVAGWFGRPRNLAIAGAVATVIVGAGIVLINSHEIEMPLRRSQLESRTVAPAAPSSLEVQQSEPPALGLPTPTLGSPSAPGEPASDSREPVADLPPSSAPGLAAEGATSQRAYEVRRDANGEDVPVNPPRSIVSPSSTPTNALQPETGGRRVIKQRKAEPMGLAPTTQSPSLAPAPSGVPLGTDTAPLMQKTAPAPTASAPTPSASVPAPTSGAPTADALARSKGAETATSLRKPAKAAAPLPAPHSITTPTTTSRAQEREERVPARTDEAQAKRSLVIDEQKDLGSGELCGQVLDNLGRAVSAAEVLIAETGTSTRTDSRGHFCIRAPAGYRTVVVMAPGYDEVRRPVAVAERNPDLAFVMSAVPAQGGGQGPTSGAQNEYGFVSRPRDSAAPAPTASAPAAPLDKPAGNTLGATRSLYGTGPSRTALDQLVSEAQRISTDAANDGSASHFEAAAEAWERVLPLVRGKPAEHDIRFHMAEQRYLAWEANPSHARSLRAHSALSSYVLRAPAGAQRDQATRWLGVVK